MPIWVLGAPAGQTQALLNGLRDGGLITRTGGDQDRRTASLLLTARGRATVSSWQDVNARILQAAIATLAPGNSAALGAALPALAELTAAVDALADSPLG